jgi:hypothetical protein
MKAILHDEESRGFRKDADGVWWHYFVDGRRIRGRYIPCLECGKRFMVWRSGKYCSEQCEKSRYEAAELVEKVCTGCGQTFKVSASRRDQECCSHSCAAKKLHRETKRETSLKDKPSEIANSDNPRFSQDEHGEWWYKTGGLSTGQRMRAYIERCERCGRKFLKHTLHKNARFCSRSCSASAPRKAWKTGNGVNNEGYIRITAPLHQKKFGKQGRTVLQHRMVIEVELDRALLPTEYVHHVNGRRHDNRRENLELWSSSQPKGQRVEDKMKWVWEMVELYEHLHPRPKPA